MILRHISKYEKKTSAWYFCGFSWSEVFAKIMFTWHLHQMQGWTCTGTKLLNTAVCIIAKEDLTICSYSTSWKRWVKNTVSSVVVASQTFDWHRTLALRCPYSHSATFTIQNILDVNQWARQMHVGKTTDAPSCWTSQFWHEVGFF